MGINPLSMCFYFNNAISKIKIDDNFSDDDVIAFKKIRKYIVEAKQYIKILNNDKTQI
jgi:hypothetical protein